MNMSIRKVFWAGLLALVGCQGVSTTPSPDFQKANTERIQKDQAIRQQQGLKY
jgi:hypothetical protein